MKRLKLCLIILFCMMTDVIEAYDFVEGNIYYNILSESDRTVEVTIKGSYSTYTGDITIPSTVQHGYRTYTVTKIASLGKSTSLTGVTIPNSVLSIGESAFSGCTGLTNIEIPVSVTSIGYSAFAGCTGLKNIEIPNSVTSIKSAVFSGCTNLANIEIPNSVTSIEGSAFYDCTSLTNIEIPNSVTSIGEYAFWNCTSLTKINIPYSVTSIGESAFSGCSTLTSIIVNDNNPVYDSRDKCNAIIETSSNTLITGCVSSIIPSSVTSIGTSAFSGCVNLTEMNIPISVISIGPNAFSDCTNLKEIIIPNSVTTIGGNSFGGCKSITSIDIPKSVTTIEGNPFYGCTGLLDISLDCLTIKDWFKGNVSIQNVHLGDNVTQIVSGAFAGCTGLRSIVIPKSIVDSNDNITYHYGIASGERVFKECFNLTDVYIDCNSIGNWFTGMSSIKNLHFGNNVKDIGEEAFKDCMGLTSLELSNSVERIESNAFKGCSNIVQIVIPNSIQYISSDAFSGCDCLATVDVDCPTIGDWFSGKSSINNVIIRDGVGIIDNNAFSGCTSIESIQFPNSIISMGNESFSGCTSLKEIIIPQSVTNMGAYVFSGCSELTKVIFDSSSTNVGSYVFQDCTKLTNVDLGKRVTSIDYGTFRNCTSLTSINIPNSVTSIGDYSFWGCCQMVDCKIGNSVAYIGERTFKDCSGLTELIIPNSVTLIGVDAFIGCDNIETVYSLVTKVFTIDEHAFSEIVFNNANLYVPKGKLATYQGTNYWSKFLNIHEGAPTEIGDLDRSYKLKVSDVGMATMYLDYPVAIPDNDDMLGVFYVSSMSDHILKLKRLKETIPANCGVIVMANTGTFTFKETLMSTDVVEDNLLTGTTKKVNVADIPGDVYTLGHGKRTGYMGFFKYTGATMPANKAYLVLNADEEEDDVLVIDRDSYADIFDATNISFVVDEEDTPIIYDLQGRRVENPSKGIYIVNGKKVYIK